MGCEHNLADVNVQSTDYAESPTLPTLLSGGYSSVPVLHGDLEHPEDFNSTYIKNEETAGAMLP